MYKFYKKDETEQRIWVISSVSTKVIIVVKLIPIKKMTIEDLIKNLFFKNNKFVTQSQNLEIGLSVIAVQHVLMLKIAKYYFVILWWKSSYVCFNYHFRYSTIHLLNKYGILNITTSKISDTNEFLYTVCIKLCRKRLLWKENRSIHFLKLSQ